jgi:alanine-glyoxylate transaminase / serine-glyoxylate transaminase / serine-pyruvate transaminase
MSGTSKDPPQMSLSHGVPYLAIPGPSTMPERVMRAMHRTAPNLYGDELNALTAGIVTDLMAVAGTAQNVAMYIGNGHATWEASAANIFSRGDGALVLASGHFGVHWAAHVKAMGVEAEVMDFGRAAPADPARLEARLRADNSRKIKAVLVTHVDTATSIRNDIAALREAMDAAGHDALLVVDCIASMGCDEFRMDQWGVDVALAASQKGLMTPPGMGFVWYSDRATARGKGCDLSSPYWAWGPRTRPSESWAYWNGTAPTHHLFGLHEALTMILREEGLEAVWRRHDVLARAVWAAFDVWGQGNPSIAMNVADPAHRGRSVTAARIGGTDGQRLREWCEAKAGVTLGIGLGMGSAADPAAAGFLRFAHMGHVNAHMTLGVIAVMEAGMRALSIPHGPGAVDAAAQVVADGA